MQVVKLYLQSGRDGPRILQSLKGHLSRKRRLYRELAVRQKDGGRSGYLEREAMEYEVYRLCSEGDVTRGGVYVYSVIYDGWHGYCQCISVIIDLPPEEWEMTKGLIDHLYKFDFTGRRTSSEEQRMEEKCFRNYLDKPAALDLKRAFSYESELVDPSRAETV